MSWHFLQGQEEVSSGGISWDGDAFVLSKSKTILGGYCLPDSKTAPGPGSPYGMTLRRSTDDRGEDVLMWFQGDSPVRTYQPPAKVKELRDPDLDCGPRWRGSLAKYNPHSYSWRTAQHSLFGGLTGFSRTWPRWGMMRRGECWALSMPVPHTGEKESGLWPTPNVSGAGNPPVNLTKKGNHYVRRSGKKAHLALDQAVKMWPTPTASRGGQEPEGKTGRKLTTVIGGELNPNWVEWLMGWPIGWTDLQPLERGKFQQWLDSHGKH